MKVLCTGVAGFIMSHVARHLLAAGHEVIGIDDLSGGSETNIPDGVTFFCFDMCEGNEVDSVVRGFKPDAIIHGAAYAAEGLSPHIRRYNYETNLVGSVNLINAAVNHDVKLFVFLSSIAVYGHGEPGHGEAPFNEQMTPRPCDPYGIAKYAVEMDLKAAGKYFGLKHVIFRPHNVYGPNQNIADPYRNVIGIFMNQCLQERPMTIFGDGSQTRAFSYISNVAPAIAACISRPETWGCVFNIGGSFPHSVRELATAVADAMGVECKIESLPPRNEVMHAYCDQSRARAFFHDLLEDVPLWQGLRAMAAWVQEHGAQSGQRFSNIEIEKNLPPSWAALT